MNGGTVIETIVLADQVWINCRDLLTGDERAIYVAISDPARCISEGDLIEWFTDHAKWTSFCGGVKNYELRKIGTSGVTKPI